MDLALDGEFCAALMNRLSLGTTYQWVLILLGAVATLLFGVFFYRELFPEYRIYQDDYIALEQFRSTYTHEPPAPFKEGVKQIVIEREDKGPPVVDRCISCHVALQVEAFSPMRLKKDLKGKIIEDDFGVPVKEENPDYIWKKLEEAKNRELDALKTAEVRGHIYDVTKVLQMHPLMGKETRPFEYHPIEEYGCTSCHGGNGNGLVTDRAHGPVFDGQYEEENRGYVPQFLEKDPVNDPPFSRVFNAKPASRLLFQTNPLYVGALIQAKCVQCHRQNIEPLTKDYQKGQALFLSQGCYACHRIAGRSRGGVGPELSRSGDGYPWFIKESIVWPQADLRTSTMPNFRLDHEELEALTTYLLGQSSKNKTMSETEKRSSLAAWEGGKKLPWELPVSKEERENLSYGMTVFATEGCASCHRLKGYESNTGFTKVEELQKEKKWFESLFPESILGSQIVQAVEKNQKEIDARIADNVREGSLLEAIEKEHPGAIEAFYSNFKFAARAKNSDEWKARINRVLKMYIQTYGLGRLICPRPNFAGVYRSDQWLMEHFKNPASHVPRSIMPVFPFDDTKFYALTYTLDKLAELNALLEREVIQKEGFDPAQAYITHCAQCHGMSRQGDGPVSEWIYPIPKNLLRAEFLRSLTKEQAILSITHGVKGTPMPPWGEVGEGKQTEPILSEEQIKQLVDWLYSALPLESVLPSEKESPKWNYQIGDVMRELKSEGALESHIEEFYTPENIQAGQRFFFENCAPCHGKEGDGAGSRAEAMADAKPRMLTNLDWISSKDDISLLRSIKYGVPGTAMTPWGDLTSAKQRLQLVMFIRSLSKEGEKRRKLTDALYQAFGWKGNGEKEIYYKIGMGFISLGASEEMQQQWRDFILKKESPEDLMHSIDEEIQKHGSEGWKKQKAEIQKLENK
jgi:mono/diheme cytochrome c family protein